MRVGVGKLKIRKRLRRESAGKMDGTFDLFRRRNIVAGGWKEKKRKG